MSPSPSLAGRALLAVGLMIGFYALAFAVAAGLLSVIYLELSIGRINARLTIFCLIGAGLILWSIIPRPDRFVAPGPALNPAEQPRLFDALEGVAKATEQAMPAEVYLVADLNAWVAQRGGIMGFGSHRVMGLGLPLLQILTVSQLRAVLAHEFGHYYGGDTRLGPWIYKTRAAIERTLQSLGGRGSILHVLFQLYGKMFLRITHAISRQQEFTADRLAADTVGARPLADGLQVIHGGAAAFMPYWNSEVMPVLNAGYRPPLADGFRQFVAHAPVADAITQSVDREIAEGQADPYDTHPTLRERLAAISALPNQAPPADDPPAITLLDNIADLELRLIAGLADEGRGHALKPVAWNDVGTAVYLPIWEQVVQENGAALAGLTPGALPDVVREPQRFAPQLDDLVSGKASADERRQRLGWLLGVALSAALARQGWAIQAPPGDTIYARKDEQCVKPFEVVAQLDSGELDAEAWRRQCAAAGITDLPLDASVVTP